MRIQEFTLNSDGETEGKAIPRCFDCRSGRKDGISKLPLSILTVKLDSGRIIRNAASSGGSWMSNRRTFASSQGVSPQLLTHCKGAVVTTLWRHQKAPCPSGTSPSKQEDPVGSGSWSPAKSTATLVGRCQGGTRQVIMSACQRDAR